RLLHSTRIGPTRRCTGSEASARMPSLYYGIFPLAHCIGLRGYVCCDLLRVTSLILIFMTNKTTKHLRISTQQTAHRRGSFATSIKEPTGAATTATTTTTDDAGLRYQTSRRPPALHPVLPKSNVPILQPSTVCTVHPDPTVGITFREDVIVTTDRRG